MNLATKSHLYYLKVAIIHGFALLATAKDPISLNVRSNDGFICFTVQVEVVDDTAGLGPQQLLLDTGSSALLFCNKGLANSNSISPLTYPGESHVLDMGQPNDQCIGAPFLMGNAYGTNPNLYFWGNVYTGDLLITSHGATSNSSSRKLSGVAFAIAEDLGKYFICQIDPVMDGIWGIAFFQAGNQAHAIIPGANCEPSNVLCFTKECSSTDFDESDWCVNGDTNSPTFNLETVITTAAQEQGSPLFGIYLDSSATDFASLVNTEFTYDAGELFTGSDAIQNKYYQKDSINAIATSNIDSSFWNLPLTSMQVFCGSSSNSNNGNPVLPLESYCMSGSCILDSGTPKFIFPQAIVSQITSCPKTEGTLQIKMTGGELNLVVSELNTLFVGKWIEDSESNGDMVILGFPTWLWYYIIFDYGSGVEGQANVTFVNKT